MYSPPYNRVEDRAELVEFMRANNFPVLVTGLGGSLHASHLPAMVQEEGAGDAIGAILALPVAETVKTAGKDEAGVQRIAATQDRSQLWLAQTPQMFRAGLLTQALARAQGATDEAAAIEQMGLQPRLVLGSRQNLKVTYPEDVAIAEAILARSGMRGA